MESKTKLIIVPINPVLDLLYSTIPDIKYITPKISNGSEKHISPSERVKVGINKRIEKNVIIDEIKLNIAPNLADLFCGAATKIMFC